MEKEGYLYQRPDGGLSRATPGKTSLRFVERRESVKRLYGGGVRHAARVALRVTGLTFLLVGATAFTIRNRLDYPGPGELINMPIRLPAAVIKATAPNEDPFRISQVLRKYTRNASDADRIANAVVSEGKKKKIDPAMIVGMMILESDMNPRARSFVGARGLMQVMPFHRGRWGCKSRDLYDIESNICHGVSVLADNIKRAPNLRTALQRYNGCVRGANTPNCGSYSGKVLRARDRMNKQLLSITD